MKIKHTAGPKIKKSQANAQLISAAPELLKACQESLAVLCTEYVNGKATIGLGIAGGVIDLLKTAIKKAKSRR